MFPYRFFKEANRNIDRMMEKEGYGSLHMKLLFRLGCAPEAIKMINNSKDQLWFEFATAYGWAEYKLDWCSENCRHAELQFNLPDENISWHFAD